MFRGIVAAVSVAFFLRPEAAAEMRCGAALFFRCRWMLWNLTFVLLFFCCSLEMVVVLLCRDRMSPIRDSLALIQSKLADLRLATNIVSPPRVRPAKQRRPSSRAAVVQGSGRTPVSLTASSQGGRRKRLFGNGHAQPDEHDNGTSGEEEMPPSPGLRHLSPADDLHVEDLMDSLAEELRRTSTDVRSIQESLLQAERLSEDLNGSSSTSEEEGEEDAGPVVEPQPASTRQSRGRAAAEPLDRSHPAPRRAPGRMHAVDDGTLQALLSIRQDLDSYFGGLGAKQSEPRAAQSAVDTLASQFQETLKEERSSKKELERLLVDASRTSASIQERSDQETRKFNQMVLDLKDIVIQREATIHSLERQMLAQDATYQKVFDEKQRAFAAEKETLLASASDLSSKLQSVKTECFTAAQRQADAFARCEALAAEVRALRTAESEWRSKHAEGQKHRAELESMNQSLRTELQVLEGSWKISSRQREQELLAEVDALRSAASNASLLAQSSKREADRLERESEMQLKVAEESHHKQLEIARSRVEAAEAAGAESERRSRYMQDRVAELESALFAAKSALDAANSNAQVLQKRVVELERQFDDVSSSYRALESTDREARTKFRKISSEYESQLEDLRSKMSAMSEHMNQQREELLAAHKENDIIRSEVADKVQTQTEHLRQREGKLLKELEETRRRADVAESDLEEIRSQVNRQLTIIESKESEWAKQVSDLRGSVEAERVEWHNKILGAEAESRSRQEEIDRCKEEISRLATEIRKGNRALEQERSQRQADLGAFGDEKQTMMNAKLKADGELTRTKKKLETEIKQRIDAQSEARESGLELDRVRKSLEREKKRREDAERRLSKVEKKLNESFQLTEDFSAEQIAVLEMLKSTLESEKQVRSDAEQRVIQLEERVADLTEKLSRRELQLQHAVQELRYTQQQQQHQGAFVSSEGPGAASVFASTTMPTDLGGSDGHRTAEASRLWASPKRSPRLRDAGRHSGSNSSAQPEPALPGSPGKVDDLLFMKDVYDVELSQLRQRMKNILERDEGPTA